ncbi:MAG TPA: 3-deoxy-8-phosphooctulonate synthase [Candidatus Sabulitectum sp.]|nr:3-deoxy-8-phosphooctulonate synthase [Candidatus Sabulitectum sp.]HPJ28152.1 3-deoxy-8-phosphooctulonate synthase [Candidatus Sabulitectum sp.]HPR21818.1 3-deoxy-8-phosphooctulonate synthase [Candidatus Sabulitectum sp.]
MVQQEISLRLPLFIMGPCSIESEEVLMETASFVERLSRKHSGDASFIFKSSFLKDNRTSHGTWQGPGLERGLELLRRAGEATGLPLVTDIHGPEQAVPAAEVCSMIQIPAFLCRQTSLLEAAGATGVPVNVKKGQFMAPGNMKGAVEKLRASGAPRVTLTERGTFFGYGDLVVDMRSLTVMEPLCDGVIMDVTHSLQKPGAALDGSGGDRRFALQMARAAAAWGISGMFIEVHPRPAEALSDSAVMVNFEGAENMVASALEHWRRPE